MTPSQVFLKIKHQKNYLLEIYTRDMLTLLLAIFVMYLMKWNMVLDTSWFSTLFILPFAVINGLVVASLLHNTAHANIPNKFINKLVGHYSGFYVLYGFSNFILVHFLHHQHSDGELDPVNPKGMNFVTFLFAPMRYMIKTTKTFLYKIHGTADEYQKIMTAQSILFNLNLILRLIIWYMLLGHFLFFVFYLPTVLTITAVYAHINFICHQENKDGVVEIVNLDHNIYFKCANFFTMGGYYHKNHHLNMKLFNPANLKKNPRKLMTT